MTTQEAAEFANFILKYLEEKDPTTFLSIYGLWKVYCSSVAFSLRVERINRYRPERKCYGAYDERNSLCTVHCRFSGSCALDSKNEYKRCRECFRPAELGANYCVVHRRKAREKSRRSHRHRSMNHVCLSCSNPLPEGHGSRYCRSCHDKRTASAGVRRRKRLAGGRCGNCNRPLNEGVCKHCRSLQKSYCEKRRLGAAKRKEPFLQQMDEMIMDRGGKATAREIAGALGPEVKIRSVAAALGAYDFQKMGAVSMRIGSKSRKVPLFGPRPRVAVTTNRRRREDLP